MLHGDMPPLLFPSLYRALASAVAFLLLSLKCFLWQKFPVMMIPKVFAKWLVPKSTLVPFCVSYCKLSSPASRINTFFTRLTALLCSFCVLPLVKISGLTSST